MKRAKWILGLALLVLSVALILALRIGATHSTPESARSQADVGAESRRDGLLTSDEHDLDAEHRLPAGAASATADTTLETIVHARRVRVVSANLFELDRAEVERTDGTWEFVPVQDGWTAELDRVPPFRLRAPGHAAAWVTRLGATVVLEPECFIVVEYPKLRARTREMVIAAEFGDDAGLKDKQKGFAVCAWIDDDRFQVAVTPRAYKHSFGATFSLRCRLSGDYDVSVTHDLETEHRTSCRLPLDGINAAPVDLQVAFDGAVGQPVELVLARSELTDALARDVYPWGQVILSNTAKPRRLSVETPGTIAIPDLILGDAYAVTAVGGSPSRYGRSLVTMEALHQAITLTLVEGNTIAFELRAPHDHAIPPRVVAEWQHRLTLERDDALLPEETLWHGQRDVAVIAGGRVELHVPDTVPMWQGAAWPAPSFIDIELRVDGFEDVRQWTALPRGGLVDAGVVNLVPLVPDLVLAPGHQLDASELTAQRVSLDVAGVGARIEIQEVHERPDGGAEVRLARIPGGQREFHATTPSGAAQLNWQEHSPRYIVVTESGITGRPFELVENRTYRAMETRRATRVIVVDEIPTGCAEVYLGWTWNGIDHVIDVLRPLSLGAPQSLAFEVPVGPLSLWWSKTRWRPSDLDVRTGRSVPLDTLNEPFHIP